MKDAVLTREERKVLGAVRYTRRYQREAYRRRGLAFDNAWTWAHLNPTLFRKWDDLKAGGR